MFFTFLALFFVSFILMLFLKPEVVQVILLCILISFLMSHQAKAEDTRERIAVIDSGVSQVARKYMCKDGHFDFTGTGLEDSVGHGTNVAGIIAKKMNVKKQCLMIIKFYTESNTGSQNLNNEIAALDYALAKKVKYVNLSISGPDENLMEQYLINKLLESGTKIVVAAGNDGKNLGIDCNAYPACTTRHANFYVVGSNSLLSNREGPVNVIENGQNVDGFGIKLSGTSQAAAVFMGKLISK